MRKNLLKLTLGCTVVFAAFAIACSNPALPKECIEAAEQVNSPQIVLDWMHNPTGDLNASERAAMRKFLNHFELDEACADAFDYLK